MTTLVDRYVDEATSDIGSGARDELRREIHGMVDELVEARMARGETPEAATARVLNELGNPRRLGRQYVGDERHLIGPDHYDQYVALLRALVLRVLPLSAIVILALNLLDGAGSIGSLVGGAVVDTVWTTYVIGVQVAFWVTIAFVIMERSRRPGAAVAQAKPADGWTVADLPPVAPKRQISLADTLSSLAFTAFIGVILVVVYRRGVDMYIQDGGGGTADGMVPLFNPDIPLAIAWVVLGLLAADAALEVVKYTVGFWTRPVTVAQILLAVLWIAVALVIVGGWDLVNPGIGEVVSGEVADTLTGAWVEQAVLAGVFVTSAIAIWEAVRGYLAWRPGDDQWSV